MTSRISFFRAHPLVFLSRTPFLQELFLGKCSLFSRNKTYVGAMNGALYETNRTGEARQPQNNAKLKTGASPRFNLPPITFWWP